MVEREADIGETFRFRQSGITDEAVGPEVGDADFQGVGAFFQVIRYLHFIWHFPKGADTLSVDNDFGFVSYFCRIGQLEQLG